MDHLTVAELRNVIAELPDDMIVVTYQHGYLSEEFNGAEVIAGGGKHEGIEEGKQYLLIY